MEKKTEISLKRRVDAKMLSPDGIRSMTHKLDIGTDSVYVKVSVLERKIVHLDVTLSRGTKNEFDDLPKSQKQAELEHDNYDISRAWVEDSCRMASKLLEQEVSIFEIIDMWRGINGFPKGVCPQLECIVPGPLHAAAMLLERKKDEWIEKLSY